ARGLAQEIARRGRRGDEGEGAVGIAGDLHRDRHALLQRLRRRVELLAELHDVEAALAERRPDGRRRVGLPGRDLELYVTVDLLCHFQALFCLRRRRAALAAGALADPPARWGARSTAMAGLPRG